MQFQFIAVSPGCNCYPDVPIAATRAGAVGLLDLRLSPTQVAESALRRVETHRPHGIGVLLDGSDSDIEDAALARAGFLSRVVFAQPHPHLSSAVEHWRDRVSEIGLVVTSEHEAASARDLEVDFVIAKGHEAGGYVGGDSTFVLLQKLLAREGCPVYAWGGIGLYSAAAACAGGAAGVVLDWQLALLRESRLPGELKRRISCMDGSETVAIPVANDAGWFRCYDRPGMSACAELQALADRDASGEEWEARVRILATEPSASRRLLPVSQDAATASRLAKMSRSVGRTIQELRRNVEAAVRGAAKSRVLDRHGPLAQSHGTIYPIVQGPMTHVSDESDFCQAVESGGGLPFLALALMREDASKLLSEGGKRMGERPWGVGILGFADQQTRAAQLAAIEAARPPFAIIAGGRPDQAAALERKGIITYLHVPTTVMLEGFLSDGARHFIFEGRECGGHVGPSSSFALWDAMIGAILDADLPATEAAKIRVLFAGGIHDARSAAMVAALAQPLVERGMQIGVLMGTAYLFTQEAVANNAVVKGFQDLALITEQTDILETAPGHGIRCARSSYTEAFKSERLALRRNGTPQAEITQKLETLNRGRLRIASKGIDRAPESKEPNASRDAVTYLQVDSATQKQEGMFMLGQVATLRDSVTTIEALHDNVGPGSVAFLEQASERLASAITPHPAAPEPLDIAIVGMGCLLPDANDPPAFWDNILTQHDAVREIPPDRFDWSVFFDSDRNAHDKIYSRWGGFLQDIPFDPLKYGIPPTALSSIEPVQLLTLVLVDQALRDAGYDADNPLSKHTSVIFGAGGGMGELGSGYTTRATLPQYIRNPEEGIYERLPEWTEDSFPGILLNIIAGRVSNRFDLGGVNFTVDAACASSLAAVYLGCRELVDGTSDMVIAGGVDTVQNPMGYLCFSKTQALSPRGRSRAFDRSADGIAISEGLACVILKRREDAERDGDRIYAMLRGIAGGSDGRQKSLTVPAASGQLSTLWRAYEQAAINPASVALFEAHGTGTSLGDPTESRALIKLLREAGAQRHSAALGSIKSNIGHTKSAAGITGLLKATLAIEAGVLPATLHVEAPNPSAGLDDGPLYLNTETRPWVRHGAPRRAAVSAFGFGGSNFHAVLEEYEGRLGAERNPRRTRPSELFVFNAGETDALVKKIRTFARAVGAAHDAGAQLSLADLAYTLQHSRLGQTGTKRAAVVARDVDNLIGQLSDLTAHIESETALTEGLFYEKEPLGAGTPLTFLFSGQGSQYVNMLRDLAVEFCEVRDCLERADLELSGAYDRPLSQYIYPPPAFDHEKRGQAAAELKSTDIAQPALGVCEVALVQLLASFGVRPDISAGHSYGELVALHAAGCLDEKALYRLSYERAQAMLSINDQSVAGDLGGMVSIQGDEETARDLLGDLDQVWLANLNGPKQTVVSGTQAELTRVEANCEAAGVQVTRLPVACGFHSPLMAHASERFREALAMTELNPPETPVFNNSTAQQYSDDANEIRRLLSENLVRQVRFGDEIEAIYSAGARLFVETGPHHVLARLVNQVLYDRHHASLSLDVRGRDGLTQLHHALAGLFTHGVSVDLERLYTDRALQVLDLTALSSNPRPEIGPHTWLVNGAYARSATEAARVPESDKRLAIESQPSNRLAQTSENQRITTIPNLPDSTVVSGDFAQFQETMRTFLRTQESILTAYLGDAHPRLAQPRVNDNPSESRPVTPTENPEQPPHSEAFAPSYQGDGTDLETILWGVAAERTGYPPELLEAEADLEADLGIDSIKRVEIVAAVRRQILPSLAEPPGWFMEQMTEARTLSAILDGLLELSRQQGLAQGGKVAETDPGEQDLESILRGVAAERTGYPSELLEVEADLEADLGIDSIKRVEIVAAVRRQILPGLADPPEWFMEQMTGARTLSAILDGLRALYQQPTTHQGEERPQESTMEIVAQPASPGGAIRCTVESLPAPLPNVGNDWLPDGLVLVTDDGEGVAQELIRAIEKRGGEAVLLHPDTLTTRQAADGAIQDIRHEKGPIGALMHLSPMCDAAEFPGIDAHAWRAHIDHEIRGLLFLLQALRPELNKPTYGYLRVLAASRGGGDFLCGEVSEALHPWRGGLAGLLKTAAREWEAAHFRAVDFDKRPDAARLLAELAASGPVEIGWRMDERLTVRAIRSDLDDAEGNTTPILHDSDVVLATGGARGITAKVLLALAERAPATFVLLGRSPLPEQEENPDTAKAEDVQLRRLLSMQMQREGDHPTPQAIEARVRSLLAAREIRHTTTQLERQGSRVEYITCDVTDSAALEQVIHSVSERHGGIDLVVHGAGTIEDRLIPDKSADSFDRVVHTKLAPILTLQRLLVPERLRALVLFASVAGFFGNPGQADYAAANEILNRLARRLHDLIPGKVIAFNWGPWQGSGMVTPEVARQFGERGIGLIDATEGGIAAWRELQKPFDDGVRVVIGAGPWVQHDEDQENLGAVIGTASGTVIANEDPA